MRFFLAFAFLILFIRGADGGNYLTVRVRFWESGAARRAGQRLVIEPSSTQWENFVKIVRGRLSLPESSYLELTFRDPFGTVVSSVAQLPRRSGSYLTVVPLQANAESDSLSLMNQLESAINTIYKETNQTKEHLQYTT